MSISPEYASNSNDSTITLNYCYFIYSTSRTASMQVTCGSAIFVGRYLNCPSVESLDEKSHNGHRLIELFRHHHRRCRVGLRKSRREERLEKLC